LLACLTAGLLAAAPGVAIDLSAVTVERLDNGLVVLVLEEHTLPVASVQMLYRVGSRDEGPGHTGLAHFVEHMAFRATESFPVNDVVRRIYAVGGEWHGYTWIDQTTYFATVPREHLDLLLAIEADRMTSLLLAEDEVEAERGAVMAELRGYEEDPETVLTETVPAVVFLQHPYRYNTIGWPSDVEAIRHEEIVAFYHEHYRPANAVLAIVGDIDTAEVLSRVRERFAAIPGGEPPVLPPTIEPPQHGERRVTLEGETGAALFEIGWRAPAVTSPDWPAFLLLQEVLGGSGGVNFHQEGFGVPVRSGSRLAGIADSTWLSPTAMPYVFTIAGSAPPEGSSADVEAAIDSALGRLRTAGVGEAEIEQARMRLREELVFDLETTEDAAHQLAFYAGLGALDVLLSIDERLAAVTADEVTDVARRYLSPGQRTVGWFVPVAAGLSDSGKTLSAPRATPATPIPALEVPRSPAHRQAEPGVLRLANGLPVVVQPIGISSSAHLRVLVGGTGLTAEAEVTEDLPLWDSTSLGWKMLADTIETGVSAAREALERIQRAPVIQRSRFDLALERAAGLTRSEPAPAADPLVAVLVGDLDPEKATALLERELGHLTAPTPSTQTRSVSSPPAETATIERLPARTSGRARLGYGVSAPPPSDPDWAAWRMLLYVLTHDYEGRLGHAAIHERGLAYYIDSDYVSDGRQAGLSFRLSAEPAKLEELTELVTATLEDLRRRPPTDDEVTEAKRHLLGRRVSAAQSNAEISARLIQDLLWYGRPQTVDDLEARLTPVTVADLERIVPAFLSGRLVVEPVQVD
jgi:zinc protease